MGCVWVFSSALRQGGVCMGVFECFETGWDVYGCFRVL